MPAPSEVGSLVGADLLARWSDPRRRYHDTLHLTEVLDRLNHLPAGRAVPVRLAAWFHDAVYDATAPAGASEEASAILLDHLGPPCGFDAPTVTEAARLVRLTATHEVSARDRNAAALSDADLAILAAPPERYLDYAAGVRAEYAHVNDDAFTAGRAAVLARLLALDPMFATATGARPVGGARPVERHRRTADAARPALMAPAGRRRHLAQRSAGSINRKVPASASRSARTPSASVRFGSPCPIGTPDRMGTPRPPSRSAQTSIAGAGFSLSSLGPHSVNWPSAIATTPSNQPARSSS